MDLGLQLSVLCKLQMDQQMYVFRNAEIIQSGKYPLQGYVFLLQVLLSYTHPLSYLNSSKKDHNGEYINSHNLQLALG